MHCTSSFSQMKAYTCRRKPVSSFQSHYLDVLVCSEDRSLRRTNVCANLYEWSAALSMGQGHVHKDDRNCFKATLKKLICRHQLTQWPLGLNIAYDNKSKLALKRQNPTTCAGLWHKLNLTTMRSGRQSSSWVCESDGLCFVLLSSCGGACCVVAPLWSNLS